jgi:hypothetical protein
MLPKTLLVCQLAQKRIFFQSFLCVASFFVLFLPKASGYLVDATQLEACRPFHKTGLKKDEVYKNSIFKQGEKALYEVYYGSVLVGHGSTTVLEPRMYLESWHQVFEIKAYTGDWYKYIFTAEDVAYSYEVPDEFVVSFFDMYQNEKKFLGSHQYVEKKIVFDHESCLVKEFIHDKVENSKAEKSYALVPGTSGVLSALYKLRGLSFKVGVRQYIQVYSSGNNWILEILPEKYEVLNTPLGYEPSVKLDLKTYIGQAMQQKGKVNVWIGTKNPKKPLLQVIGEIKIGNVAMILKEFKG